MDTERKSIVVAVGNSTYLECLPKSHHASVTWLKETGENSAELHQVDYALSIHTGLQILHKELATLQNTLTNLSQL